MAYTARVQGNGDRVLVRLPHCVNHEKLTYWRQRFSVKLAFEWDENSRFFHASASGRKRRNAIPELLDDSGHLHTNHAAKSTLLLNFYSNLLGQTHTLTWGFTLTDLYPSFTVNDAALCAPFTLDELSAALFAMNVNSSPGPDGFGPAFYRSLWHETRHDLLSFSHAFQRGDVDLDGLNRALLVLLPKKDGANTPDAFRPISLQNCPMKLVTKMLSNRIRPLIPSLIDAD